MQSSYWWVHSTERASSLRMKPGGLPCLERTSNQSPLDATTLILTALDASDNVR